MYEWNGWLWEGMSSEGLSKWLLRRIRGQTEFVLWQIGTSVDVFFIYKSPKVSERGHRGKIYGSSPAECFVKNQILCFFQLLNTFRFKAWESQCFLLVEWCVSITWYWPPPIETLLMHILTITDFAVLHSCAPVFECLNHIVLTQQRLHLICFNCRCCQHCCLFIGIISEL